MDTICGARLPLGSFLQTALCSTNHGRVIRMSSVTCSWGRGLHGAPQLAEQTDPAFPARSHGTYTKMVRRRPAGFSGSVWFACLPPGPPQGSPAHARGSWHWCCAIQARPRLHSGMLLTGPPCKRSRWGLPLERVRAGQSRTKTQKVPESRANPPRAATFALRMRSRDDPSKASAAWAAQGQN